MKKQMAIFWAIAAALSAPAAEFRPAAVTAATETYGARYAAAKMIDGDLATYACFQDDSRTGKDAKSDPPFAAAPVTCSFVLDLGAAREVAGLKLVSRNCWAPTMASDVSVWACADGKGTQGLVPLAENVALPPVVNSYAAYVTWPKTKARYLKVQVNDANRKPIRGGWFTHVMWEWARMHGDPISGDGKWYNCQIAEVAAFDALPADAPAPNAPDVARAGAQDGGESARGRAGGRRAREVPLRVRRARGRRGRGRRPALARPLPARVLRAPTGASREAAREGHAVRLHEEPRVRRRAGARERVRPVGRPSASAR